MFKFFVAVPHLPTAILGMVVAHDDTPTVHYYGTVTLSGAFEEAEMEAMGLYRCDEEEEAQEAESDALYNREMRL